MSDQWTELGREFGYPECCISEFKNTRVENPDYGVIRADNASMRGQPWMGTGFIPCKNCRPDASEDFQTFVAQYITPNRTHPLPFPEESENECRSDGVLHARY